MAAKTSWHRYGTTLRQSHPMYRKTAKTESDAMLCHLMLVFTICFLEKFPDAFRQLYSLFSALRQTLR